MTARRFRLVATLAITLIFLLAWAFPIVWSVLNSLKTDRDVLAYPPKLSVHADARTPIATCCSARARSCRI